MNIHKSLPSIYKELIFDALVKYRDEQVNIDSLLNFFVTKDYASMPGKEILPLVSVYSPDTRPNESSTTAYNYFEEVATYTIDMITSEQANDDKKAEQVAVERLELLIYQVKSAIYRLSQSHFGKKIGDLGKKKFANVSIFAQNQDQGYEGVVGARMTFDLMLPFVPLGDIEKLYAKDNGAIKLLASVLSIDTGKFKANYSIGES